MNKAAASPADMRGKVGRSGLRSWLELSFALPLFGLLGALPLSLSYRLAETLVRWLFRLGVMRRKSIEQLRLAYGDALTDEDIDRLMDANERHQAWILVDIVLAPRLVERRLQQIDMEPLVSRLKAAGIGEGRPAIIFSSHQGTAEVGSLALARVGYPHFAYVRPLDNLPLWRRVSRDRERWGRRYLSKFGSARQAFRLVRDGHSIGLQMDQDAGRRGLFVPYFGRPASTHATAATLAVLADVPMFGMYCLRTGDRRFRYRLEGSGPFYPPNSGDQQADILELTRQATADIEEKVRGAPEQQLWAHYRWKSKPPDA